MVRNDSGTALLQAMVVTLFMSILAGSVASMSENSSQEIVRQQKGLRLEALAHYVATLGADEQLCAQTLRIVGGGSFPVPEAYDAVVGGDGSQGIELEVKLPITIPNGTPISAGSWYPRVSATDNRLPEFGGYEITGVKLWRARNSRCPATGPCSSAVGGQYASATSAEFEGELAVYGLEPLVEGATTPRKGFRKTAARLKMRINKATGAILGCFTTMSDEQFCTAMGGDYNSSSPPDQAACRFLPGDLPKCTDPDAFIGDLDNSGPDGAAAPVCKKIKPCDPGKFAVGMRNDELICRPFPDPVIVRTTVVLPTSTPTSGEGICGPINGSYIPVCDQAQLTDYFINVTGSDTTRWCATGSINNGGGLPYGPAFSGADGAVWGCTLGGPSGIGCIAPAGGECCEGGVFNPAHPGCTPPDPSCGVGWVKTGPPPPGTPTFPYAPSGIPPCSGPGAGENEPSFACPFAGATGVDYACNQWTCIDSCTPGPMPTPGPAWTVISDQLYDSAFISFATGLGPPDPGGPLTTCGGGPSTCSKPMARRIYFAIGTTGDNGTCYQWSTDGVNFKTVSPMPVALGMILGDPPLAGANTPCGPVGTTMGFSAYYPLPSDFRLKTDIVLIGQENGFNIYEYKYKDEFAKNLGMKKGVTYIGVMAQDVLKIKPEAVVKMANGYYGVRYDLLGVQFREK